MSWKDIVNNWIRQENRVIVDLQRQLVQENMIPSTLVDNLTLQSILLTQVILETLSGITVPRPPQDRTFANLMNTKQMMMLELNQKNGALIKVLEEKTGVNLDHYHKLIGNK